MQTTSSSLIQAIDAQAGLKPPQPSTAARSNGSNGKPNFSRKKRAVAAAAETTAATEDGPAGTGGGTAERPEPKKRAKKRPSSGGGAGDDDAQPSSAATLAAASSSTTSATKKKGAAGPKKKKQPTAKKAKVGGGSLAAAAAVETSSASHAAAPPEDVAPPSSPAPEVPPGVIRTLSRDKNLWNTVVKVLHKHASRADLVATEDGLRLQAVELGNASVVDAVVQKEAFAQFSFGGGRRGAAAENSEQQQGQREEIRCVLNLAHFRKVLRAVAKNTDHFEVIVDATTAAADGGGVTVRSVDPAVGGTTEFDFGLIGHDDADSVALLNLPLFEGDEQTVRDAPPQTIVARVGVEPLAMVARDCDSLGDTVRVRGFASGDAEALSFEVRGVTDPDLFATLASGKTYLRRRPSTVAAAAQGEEEEEDGNGLRVQVTSGGGTGRPTFHDFRTALILRFVSAARGLGVPIKMVLAPEQPARLILASPDNSVVLQSFVAPMMTEQDDE